MNVFPPPAGLAEDALLLVAHVLAPQEFLFHLLPLGMQQTFRSLEKSEFRAGRPARQILRREGTGLVDAAVQLFKSVADPGDLLIGRSQA